MSDAGVIEEAAQQAALERDGRLGSAERRSYGIVHTPRELRRFLVVELDQMLKRAGASAGLRTAGLTVIDPACGTGLFFASVLRFVGDAPDLNLVGIDRDRAAIQSAKTAFVSHSFNSNGAKLRWVVAEALESLAVTEVAGPLAILGNPPWAGRTEARSRFSDTLIEPFRCDAEGVRLPERKLGVLSDTYVRFVAWSTEALRRCAKRGHPAALSFVLNSSFLDGPVHRGMRGVLSRTFDSVRITDLGGSALVARDGRVDQNVFPIRTGVTCLTASLAPRSIDDTASAEVSDHAVIPVIPVIPSIEFAQLWGTRSEKLTCLAESRLPYESVPITEPRHLFRPLGGEPFPNDWVGLDALFPFHQEGVQTNRDAVVTDVDRARLLDRMKSFAAGSSCSSLAPALRRLAHYDPDRARMKVQAALANNAEGQGWICVLAYRPGEPRWFVDLTPLCHRPRKRLRAAMEGSTFALITVRKDRGQRAWRHFAVTEHIVDNCYLSTRSSCRARAFPTHGPNAELNLSALGNKWRDALGVDPLALHYYVAAWLGCAAYQNRFGAALRLGYPQIPPPQPGDEVMAVWGQQLVREWIRPSEIATQAAEIGHWTVPLPRRSVGGERAWQAVEHRATGRMAE